MAQNRYLPYGYQVENGAIQTHDAESEVIRRIYREYAAGLSYKAIAELLTADGIRYMPDKPAWNKNMVARILQNQHYLGTEKYPAIVEDTLQTAVQQAQKPYTHTEPKEIKELKGLFRCTACGGTVKRRLKTGGAERWYCENDPRHIATAVTDSILLKSIHTELNRLADRERTTPTTAPKRKNATSLAIVRLQNEIDLAMENGAPDEQAIQKQLFTLAAEKYALCEDEGVTHTLKGMKAPDTELLNYVTKNVLIAQNGAVRLVLKNENTSAEGAE